MREGEGGKGGGKGGVMGWEVGLRLGGVLVQAMPFQGLPSLSL